VYIVIVGGGNVGYFLAKALSSSSHEILLMEKDRQVHRVIAEELGEIAVQGDGCEVRLLEEAGAARADVVGAGAGAPGS
jgi:trk system potassium uptake protein TrkA